MSTARLLACAALLIGAACTDPPAPVVNGSLPAATPPPVAPKANPNACSILNKTSIPIDVVDTAINEPTGTIAPGGSGGAGGHFKVTAAGRTAAQSFCGPGMVITVSDKNGALQLVGGGDNEGIEKKP